MSTVFQAEKEEFQKMRGKKWVWGRKKKEEKVERVITISP
jgi:hypothetical protein